MIAAPLGAIVTVIATHNSGLSFWQELGVVVVGSVLAIGIAGCFHQAWQWYRRPKITFECGNDEEFRYRLSGRNPRGSAALRLTAIRDVYTTRLRVEETNNSQAEVEVRVLVIGERTKLMQWTDESDRFVIGPKARAYLRVCELFEYEPVVLRRAATRDFSHVPGLTRGATVRFDLQAVINGKPARTRWRFVAEWPSDAHYPDMRAE